MKKKNKQTNKQTTAVSFWKSNGSLVPLMVPERQCRTVFTQISYASFESIEPQPIMF